MRLPSALAGLIMLLAVPAALAQAARDELVIGISQYPSNFNPNIDSMMAKSYVLAMARRPFTAYDADWNLICMLCTELADADHQFVPGGLRGRGGYGQQHDEAREGGRQAHRSMMAST